MREATLKEDLGEALGQDDLICRLHESTSMYHMFRKRLRQNQPPEEEEVTRVVAETA